MECNFGGHTSSYYGIGANIVNLMRESKMYFQSILDVNNLIPKGIFFSERIGDTQHHVKPVGRIVIPMRITLAKDVIQV